MCELDATSDLEVDETQQLIAGAARISGHGVRVVAKRLADDRRARDQKRRQERAAAEAIREAGHRLVRPAPPPDGRRTEQVEEIDEALAANATDQPPMRDRTGALVEVRVQTTRSLHELTSQSANAEPLPEGVEPLPAPPEPLLVQLTDTEVELLIETYFSWFRFDRAQRRYDAALPSPFIDALMVWPRSAMPVVQALNTAPLVLPNGDVLTGSGLDRTNGLFHHIEPGLQACVPQGLVTQQAAREAVKWLCGEWLCDVLTDEIGKLATLLYAETCLQGLCCPSVPVSWSQPDGAEAESPRCATWSAWRSSAVVPLPPAGRHMRKKDGNPCSPTCGRESPPWYGTTSLTAALSTRRSSTAR